MSLTKASLIAGMVVLLAIACRPTEQPGAVYRHALDGIPGSLDPVHASDVYSGALVVNIFDTLYRYRYLTRPYQLAPNLAADFPEVSEDGLIWTIRLREEVRFADDPVFPNDLGRTVTASDVVYSLRRHFDPDSRSRTAWLWRDRIVGLDQWGADGADPAAEVAGLTATDEFTIRIELIEPYPQLLHTLALPPSAIVPREAVDYHGREFGVRPVGSGPFRLIRLDETMAAFEPNPYFDRGGMDLAAEGYDRSRHGSLGLEALDGRPYPFIDRLEIHFITEPTARWSSFAAEGEVDNVMVPAEQAQRVLDSIDPPRFKAEIIERYHGLVQPEAGFVFYGFNMANPQIGHHPEPERDQKNHALRCAMREAFDWQARNHSFYHGLGQIFPGVIPPFLAEYDSDPPRHGTGHNPDHARQRLASHDWQSADWPTLTYGLEASIHQRQMFEQFRVWMMSIGMPAEKLRQRSFPGFGELIRAVGNRQLDVFLLGWTMSYPDAQYSLQLFHSANAAPGANSFNYSNMDFDRLFDQAVNLPAGVQRTEQYRQLNQMIIDDCVIIGSLARTRIHLWDRRVRMLPDREIVGGYFMRFVAVD
jgi:oligopeptide transport system substrate-binding protein